MLKVLIVEDEPLVRQGIVLTVDWAALDCLLVGEAVNGEEGLEMARRFQPHIIVTDVKMPKMDGIEMLKALREEGLRSHVIILTAYSDFEYVQSALRLGAADYLLKPFHDGELESIITRIHESCVAREDDAPALLQLSKGDKSKYVMAALEYIAQSCGDPSISISRIAETLGISEGHLSHIFKKETDYTLMEYLTRYRIHTAMQLLRDCRIKVYEVAEKVGYRDVAYFSSTFKRIVGISPSEYQDRCD